MFLWCASFKEKQLVHIYIYMCVYTHIHMITLFIVHVNRTNTNQPLHLKPFNEIDKKWSCKRNSPFEFTSCHSLVSSLAALPLQTHKQRAPQPSLDIWFTKIEWWSAAVNCCGAIFPLWRLLLWPSRWDCADPFLWVLKDRKLFARFNAFN